MALGTVTSGRATRKALSAKSRVQIAPPGNAAKKRLSGYISLMIRIAGTLVGLLAVCGSAGAQKLPLPEWQPSAAQKYGAESSSRLLDPGSPSHAPQQPHAVADGGSNAADATVITAPIFRDTGNTQGKGDDISLPACPSGGTDTAEDAWYKLTLPQGGTLTAWTTCAEPGIPTYDTRLGIFREDLTLVTCNDDDPTCGLQSRISNLSLSAGTYYIVVDGYNGLEGPYELNVEWQGPGPPCIGSNASTATVIPSLPFSEAHDLSNDCDDYLVTCELGGNQGGPDHWYRVTVDAPVFMSVTTTCDTALIDTRVAILDADQNELYCNDDAPLCPSGQSAIVDALLAEGTYYLVIDGADFVGGMYAVQVDTTHAPPGAIVDQPPDILTRMNELFDHDIVTNIVPGRTHLRLSNATANLGPGKLHLYGVLPDNGDGTQDVRQRVWQNIGTFFDRDAGAFLYHPEHGHIHVQDWAVYRLRAVAPDGGVGPIVVEGSKTSFCIVDVLVHDNTLPGFPPNPRYVSCGSSIQGLSVGWADVYTKNLQGQYIDITGVPDGDYWLESEADPLDHILEVDETNNIARIRITIGSPNSINPDAYEPNDQISDLDSRVVGAPNSPVLGPCGPSRTISGLTIHAAGNNDFFRFYMPATGGTGDEVRVDFANASGNLDLELRSAAGAVLAVSTSTANFERIPMNGYPAGWYNVRVYGVPGATSPFYSITVNPSQNGTPAIAVLHPPAGNTYIPETGVYTATWTASDPEGNETWVDVYVNTSPVLDGNEMFLLSSQSTPGAQGLYVINPAGLPLNTYYVYARITDGGTVAGDWSSGTFTILPLTGVAEIVEASAWRLLPTAPNPFNPHTLLRLQVRHESHVSWRIFDARGAVVRTLQNGPLSQGVHARTWDGRDDRGRAVASGTYYMKVEANGFTGRQKLTLLR